MSTTVSTTNTAFSFTDLTKAICVEKPAFVKKEKKSWLIEGDQKQLIDTPFLAKMVSVYAQKAGVEMIDDISKLLLDLKMSLSETNSLTEVENLINIKCRLESTTSEFYESISTWISIATLHRQVKKSMLDYINNAQTCNKVNGKIKPCFRSDFEAFVREHHSALDEMMLWENDFIFNILGVSALQRYLKRDFENNFIELPQHMWMRVAVSSCLSMVGNATDQEVLEEIRNIYQPLSRLEMITSTPILHNSSSMGGQHGSCFLLSVSDNMKSITTSFANIANISSSGGGIGINLSNLRYRKSRISSSGGFAGGLTYCQVIDQIGRYANQAGKRPGAISPCIELWHPDIEYFLRIISHNTPEDERAAKLNPQLMVNDLFMKRMQQDAQWSLFCPSNCPDLVDAYGEEFDRLYLQYEQEGKAIETISAKALWKKIMLASIETGGYYILFKDSINQKSSVKQIGTVATSNLCTEIMEPCTPEAYSTCVLGSLSLDKYVTEQNTVDYPLLQQNVATMVRVLNRITINNRYPCIESKEYAHKYRPLGIGIQSLADMFGKMRISFFSEEARKISKNITEAIYFYALQESCEIAKNEGHPYDSFEDSPLAKGQFQFDLWGMDRSNLSGNHDWDALYQKISIHGVANSLLTAHMPTSGTSALIGKNECFEPIHMNLMARETKSGVIPLVNRYLRRDLEEIGLWSEEMKGRILRNMGSIQSFEDIPQEIRDMYPTIWEVDDKLLVDLCVDRAPFIDQSQSMSSYIHPCTPEKLSANVQYAWERGCKTGKYYTHMLKKTGTDNSDPTITITPEQQKIKSELQEFNPDEVCYPMIANMGICESCSG